MNENEKLIIEALEKINQTNKNIGSRLGCLVIIFFVMAIPTIIGISIILLFFIRYVNNL